MKFEFLLLPEYGEQSERKNEQIPLFFQAVPAAGLAAMQRGNGHCYESSFFPSRTCRGYINSKPYPRVLPRGTLRQPSGHAGRYSSCHFMIMTRNSESDISCKCFWCYVTIFQTILSIYLCHIICVLFRDIFDNVHNILHGVKQRFTIEFLQKTCVLFCEFFWIFHNVFQFIFRNMFNFFFKNYDEK